MRTHFVFALALFITACGLETEPNPDYQSASGSGGSGGNGGSDAGDAGGEGGTGGGGTGGTGGDSGSGGTSGGQGGDSAVTDCDDNDACSPNLPQCSPQGRCVSCTSNAACDDRGPLEHCEMSLDSDQRGHCVECLEDDHCQGSAGGDYCLNNECVPCKTNADCTDLTKPECGTDGQCTGCTSSDACDGRADTQVCVTTAGPKRGHCVACIADADCSSADAPQCLAGNTCGPCTSDTACEDRTGTEHCNTRADADTVGQCVECTGATEADDCDGKSCKQTTGECTNIDIGDLNPCEACEADSQCGEGTKCVKHMLGDEDVGNFCFYTFEANDGCADARPSVKPYSQALTNALSVDSTQGSQQATYCLPKTSCSAIEHAATGVTCGTSNAACGIENVDDGVCLQSGSASGKCSYTCINTADCLGGVGGEVLDTCSGPEGGKTCQPE